MGQKLDRYLPAGLRRRLDALTRERGRQFFALLCGLHGIGKATPLFQSLVPALAERVRTP